MALPRNIRPEYTTTIPSTGKRIKFQPFSVKEEKILVLAAESKDSEEITNAVTNVLSNCVTSPSDFKVEDLALFDIEFLFLKARTKSVGESISVQITDPNDSSYTVTHKISLDKIKVEKVEDHKSLVEVSDGVTVNLRYPDISFFNEGVDMSSFTSVTELVARCIKQIVIEDEVYNKEDMSDQEINEWLEGLTSGQFSKLSEFFQTMPKLSHTVTLKNPNTKESFSVKLEGLADFF